MRVANFVMEIGLASEIPSYSGGLGLLSGDYALTLADIGADAVFVTLLYRKGYAHQILDRQQGQVDGDRDFDPARFLSPVDAHVEVSLCGRRVVVRAWEYKAKGKSEVPVFFLDTDVPENDDEGRRITDRLYGGDQWHRIAQEMVLGLGGHRLLKALGYKPDVYHLNEGHAAFVIAELLHEGMEPAQVRRRCVFTTHTSVPAGFDIFPLSWVKKAFEGYSGVDWDLEAEEGRINLSRMALRYCGVTNAVSLKHRFVAENVLKHRGLDYVTNGVNHRRWVHAELKRVYDRNLKGWDETPALLAGAVLIPTEELASAHANAKAEMLGMIRDRTGVDFRPDILTICQAKRIAGYKRNNLVLKRLDLLSDVASGHGPMQLVMAGKTHPADDVGKAILKDILSRLDELAKTGGRIRAVFLDDYDIDTAKLLVAGSDVWLNNPQSPFEACGTSGMKAALNGVLNLSAQDGWWLEGGLEGVNGWSIGRRAPWADVTNPSTETEDMNSLYEKLGGEVFPAYYSDKARWWKMARLAVATIGPHFNADRMADDYARIYSRLAEGRLSTGPSEIASPQPQKQ